MDAASTVTNSARATIALNCTLYRSGSLIIEDPHGKYTHGGKVCKMGAKTFYVCKPREKRDRQYRNRRPPRVAKAEPLTV